MILTWLLTPFLTIFNALFSALPSGGLDYSSATIWTGTNLKGYVASVSGFIPTDMIADFLVITITVLMPAFLIYHIAQWCYKELPEILGFGPGG